VVEAPCTGQSSGGDAALKAENAAVEVYRFAALMLGSEAEAIELVENTVAQAEIDPCADPCAVQGLVRERVLDGALQIMHRHDPASFSALPATDPAGSCIENDRTVPLTGDEISHLVDGAGRGPLRAWLERLSQAQRAVFVQRAVLGSSNADTARAINRYSKPSIWTAEAVSSLFRQALCSLATSLLHSAPAAQV
jgi:hypothetical protein